LRDSAGRIAAARAEVADRTKVKRLRLEPPAISAERASEMAGAPGCRSTGGNIV